MNIHLIYYYAVGDPSFPVGSPFVGFSSCPSFVSTSSDFCSGFGVSGFGYSDAYVVCSGSGFGVSVLSGALLLLPLLFVVDVVLLPNE